MPSRQHLPRKAQRNRWKEARKEAEAHRRKNKAKRMKKLAK